MSDIYQDYRLSALLAGADDATRSMRVKAGDSANTLLHLRRSETHERSIRLLRARL